MTGTARVTFDEKRISNPTEIDAIQETKEFWRKKTGRELSNQDAEESIRNIRGFFRVLDEWSQRS